MGMVFQQFNLFPHLTVKENITLAPVKLKMMSKEEADEERAASCLRASVCRIRRTRIRRSFPAVRSSESPLRARLR